MVLRVRKDLCTGASRDLQARVHLASLSAVDGRAPAPGKELRITLDVSDQGVHVGGAMRNEGAAVDDGHGERRSGKWSETTRSIVSAKATVEECRPPRRSRTPHAMGKGKRKQAAESNVIATNRKARHDYRIEETLEAGLVLEGWEVKSLRQGRAQLRDSYVHLQNGEAWLEGSHISPLPSASTHVDPQPARARKLLLHRRELNRLIGANRAAGLHRHRPEALLDARAGQGADRYRAREAPARQARRRAGPGLAAPAPEVDQERRMKPAPGWSTLAAAVQLGATRFRRG